MILVQCDGQLRTKSRFLLSRKPHQTDGFQVFEVDIKSTVTHKDVKKVVKRQKPVFGLEARWFWRNWKVEKNETVDIDDMLLSFIYTMCVISYKRANDTATSNDAANITAWSNLWLCFAACAQ